MEAREIYVRWQAVAVFVADNGIPVSFVLGQEKSTPQNGSAEKGIPEYCRVK